MADNLLTSVQIFGLIILGAVIILGGLKVVFKPIIGLTQRLDMHIVKQTDNEGNISEVITLLKDQIAGLDERDKKATEKMNKFVAHWRLSDQQNRQMMHGILAANNIAKEQCKVHQLRSDNHDHQLKLHSNKIGKLEAEIEIVKQKLA